MSPDTHSELSRLAALREYQVLGTDREPAFDRITDLTSRIYRVPSAAIALVDENRVWFKSHFGIDIQEMERNLSLADLVIASDTVTVIPDLSKDLGLSASARSLGGMRVGFFAGAPLITPEGHRIGALSISDTRPRPPLTEEESGMLQDLAAMAMDELTLHLELVHTREATDSLQQSEARFRTLMESASQGIVGVNRAGLIQLVNRKAEELFGYEREELIGQKLEILLPDRLQARHVEERANYFAQPHPRPMGIGLELRGRHRSGKEFPVEISLNHVRVGDDAMAIGFVTDITERTRLEQQLRQSQKMEAIGQLAGGIAHDFNNLLTVISGYSHMALDGIAPEDSVRESIEEIANAADRAAVLTGQLLAFGRKQVIQPRRFDLNARVAQTHNILRRLIGEDIQLELALGEKIGEILADPGQIDQVIMNLVVNARDAMPKGGRILLETAAVEVGAEYARGHFSVEPGPHVMLAITDSGMGMTSEVQAHIFEPFFTTKEQGKGTGLGLATVYGIVRQARGSIFVYSEIGQGTTFKIIFPRVEEAGEALPAETTPEAPGGREVILLVEDEEAVRNFVRKVLIDRGYRVVEASDGAEALLAMEEIGGQVDLVVTDVVMPKTSGPELLTQLRETYPKIKALFMSGYTDRTVPLEAEHVAAFIQKPFTPNQLAQKIRDVLAERSSA